MPVKVIADPGSCHLGQLENAKKLISIAKHCGADAVKFQLFESTPGNIPVKKEWIPEMMAHAKAENIELFFSVWGFINLDTVLKAGCKSVKFAYSQRNEKGLIQYAKTLFENVYVSGDVMTWPDNITDDVIKLYCIPQYPVPFIPDFDGLFPERFDGFSSHCMGIRHDIKAAYLGAKYIEKHFKIDIPESWSVPDGKFSLTPNDLWRLCRAVKEI